MMFSGGRDLLKACFKFTMLVSIYICTCSVTRAMQLLAWAEEEIICRRWKSVFWWSWHWIVVVNIFWSVVSWKHCWRDEAVQRLVLYCMSFFKTVPKLLLEFSKQTEVPLFLFFYPLALNFAFVRNIKIIFGNRHGMVTIF